jgi:hypothetical protein
VTGFRKGAKIRFSGHLTNRDWKHLNRAWINIHLNHL